MRMFLLKLIDTLILLYSVALIVHFILPFIVTSQQPWMATLSRICEPAVKIGNQVAAKVIPNRRFKMEIGAVVAALLCWLLRVLLGLIF